MDTSRKRNRGRKSNQATTSLEQSVLVSMKLLRKYTQAALGKDRSKIMLGDEEQGGCQARVVDQLDMIRDRQH